VSFRGYGSSESHVSSCKCLLEWLCITHFPNNQQSIKNTSQVHISKKTREYMVSVKCLTEESFNEICDQAKQLSKSTWKAEQAGSPSVEVAQKPLDWRALLV
jgi:hypothetical protein